MEEKTLASIYDRLTEPFAIEEIEIKPGATTKDKAKALALPYADRVAYQNRLDQIVGPSGWSVEYRQISENAVFCRLTILGVVREDVGECYKTDRDGQPDENRATTAVAQSFKRACNAFGIGRYLNSLPQIWAEYDGQKRQFADVPRVVADIYRRAGIRSGGGSNNNRGSYPEKSAPASEPARQARPTPKPQPQTIPDDEPAPPRPSREEILANHIQKAGDDSALRAVVDEIKQARKQNDIDDAAQDRLKVLYKQQQDKIAKANEPEPQSEARSSLRNTKPQTQPQPAQPAKPVPSRPKF